MFIEAGNSGLPCAVLNSRQVRLNEQKAYRQNATKPQFSFDWNRAMRRWSFWTVKTCTKMHEPEAMTLAVEPSYVNAQLFRQANPEI